MRNPALVAGNPTASTYWLTLPVPIQIKRGIGRKRAHLAKRRNSPGQAEGRGGDVTATGAGQEAPLSGKKSELLQLSPAYPAKCGICISDLKKLDQGVIIGCGGSS